MWKPPFWLTDQEADWGYLGCKAQVYRFSWRTWLSSWQCNKTHTLCNSCSQERKNKKEQLVSCAASTCRAEEQRLSPVTCLYTLSPCLPTAEAALPMGHLLIRPEDAPGSAETVLLKTIHAPAAVHRSMWQGQMPPIECMQWLKYLATVFRTSMSNLTLSLAGAGEEPYTASDELLNGKCTLPGNCLQNSF